MYLVLNPSEADSFLYRPVKSIYLHVEQFSISVEDTILDEKQLLTVKVQTRDLLTKEAYFIAITYLVTVSYCDMKSYKEIIDGVFLREGTFKLNEVIHLLKGVGNINLRIIPEKLHDSLDNKPKHLVRCVDHLEFVKRYTFLYDEKQYIVHKDRALCSHIVLFLSLRVGNKPVSNMYTAKETSLLSVGETTKIIAALEKAAKEGKITHERMLDNLLGEKFECISFYR